MAAFVVLSFIVLIKPLDYGLILQYLRSISWNSYAWRVAN